MLRKRVPTRVREAALASGHKGETVKFSTGTKDRKAAEKVLPELLQRWNDKLAEWERQTRIIALTVQHARRIAGQWWASAEAYSMPPDIAASVLSGSPDAVATAMRERVEAHATEALRLAEIEATADSRPLLVAEIEPLVWTAYRRAAAKSDLQIGQVPQPPPPPDPAANAVPILDLLRGWARDNGYDPDGKPIPRNYYDRLKTSERLTAFLGHKDAAKVTKADAVKWKATMAGKSLATVANDISEMSAVWRWGMANGKVTENPFAGILPSKKSRNKKQTRRAFTDDEAVNILRAARKETGALRWLPWLLACTGLRLNEACQAVKEDVVIKDGHPFLRVHTDDDREDGEAARSVKNESSLRSVPLHSLIVKEGFLEYVEGLPVGSPLFPDIIPDKVFQSRGVAAQKLVSRWLRQDVGITDKQISPSHSWRHYWITKARDCGMHPEIRDAITGHQATGNEAHNYGTQWKDMPTRLAEAMATIKLPAELGKPPAS